MSADAYEVPQSNIPIPERLTYIPSWYRPHGDLSLQVTDADGGDLGFTIGQVLPERRWAVSETGRLLSQVAFEARYRQWIERVLAPNGSIIEIKRFNKYFDVNLETIPGVDEFVDAKPDPSLPVDQPNPSQIRYVAISFTLGPDNGRSKIRPIYTYMGTKVEPEQAPPAPLGFETVEPPRKATKPSEPMVAAACGKQIKEKYVHNHKRLCKACKGLAAEAAQAQADAEGAGAAA